MAKFFAAALVLLTGCVKDLDVKPNDPFVLTSDDVYAAEGSYKSALAKIYAGFILTGSQGGTGNPDLLGLDEGFTCFVRSLWSLNELTTDEAVWSYPNDANGTIFNLHNHSWTATDGIPQALYARILNVAAIANEFLRVTGGKKDEADIKMFRAEARFLRALAYYYGMDLFKTLPFVTEADKPGAHYAPPARNREQLYAFIESELLAVKPDMGAPRFEYGRADKAVCAMLLAKLYLNSEVYVGKAKYTETLAQLKEVIEGGYELSPAYLRLFSADNDSNNKEIIFAQTCDGASSRSFGMPWIMIYGNAGNGGWAGLRTTSAFVRKFDDRPNEARALFAKEDKKQSLEIEAQNSAAQGYGVYKYRNEKFKGPVPASASGGFNDTDYVMFRLADAYLMYAEAVLRGGSGGDMNTALKYVNAIRTRSEDVANAPGPITQAQLTTDFILDERARELYWEGHRRMDLIRFKKFTSGYNWPWKGGLKNGQENTGAHRAFFPIPASDIATNPNLTQHPEYK